MSLNLLIVEDSVSYSIELEQIATEIGFNVIGSVDNSGDALDIIFSEQPDVILMDINIKGRLTGIDIAKRIVHLEIPILYITSFSDEATYQEALRSTLVGYIVKPVEKLTLTTSLKLLIKNRLQNESTNSTGLITKEDEEYIFFMKKDVYHKLRVDQILYVKSNDNYCEFTLDNGSSYLIRIKLSEVEELLTGRNFIRCHRQYIVNQRQVRAVNTAINTLDVQGEAIPFSRSKKAEIMSIGIFLK